MVEEMDHYFGRVAYGLALAAVGCVTIFGYLTFLKVTTQRQDIRKRMDLLHSLCLSDLMMTFGHTFVSSFACFYAGWPFGDFGCQAHAFMAMASSFISIGNILLISRDVYLRESGRGEEASRRRGFILLNWVFGIAGGFLPLMGVGSYGFETELKAGCVLDFHGNRNSNLLYLIVILLIWFVYPMYEIVSNYGKLDSSSKNLYLQKVVPLQMLCTYIPYGIASFWCAVYGPAFAPRMELAAVLNICIKCFFATNPFIYIASDQELKKACWEVVSGGEKATSDQLGKKKDS